MTAYRRKTRDVWQLWTNYGFGWENETEELTFREIRDRAREYRANVPGIRLRIRCRRERLPEPTANEVQI